MKRTIYLFSFSIIFSIQLLGQGSAQTLFNYFYAQEGVPVIRIDTDIKQLIRKKINEEYQPCVISFDLENGETMICESKLRARGNIRKKVCVNPPLKLNFKEKDLVNNGFDSLDILKTVMQCRDNDNTIKYVGKERLAYDLYAIIDTLSMQAKYVKFELFNKEQLQQTLNGFLIETEKHYAQRTGTIVAESGTLRSSILYRNHFLKMSFFQYMIGNPDYAIPNKHNVEILQLSDKRYVAIPYDFDYSGLVDTDYSIPHKSLPIKSVTSRIFMVKNVSFEEAIVTAEYYKSIKDKIYECIQSAVYLSEKDKDAATRYIDGFYNILNSQKRIKREFVK